MIILLSNLLVRGLLAYFFGTPVLSPSVRAVGGGDMERREGGRREHKVTTNRHQRQQRWLSKLTEVLGSSNETGIDVGGEARLKQR